MIMKLRLYKYVAVLALLAGFCSCSNDVEEIFTESSANRIDAALVDVQDILIGPANGWLMEYYPSSALVFGGYNVLMQFTFDGHVTVASEAADPNETATSTYTLKQSAGAVLSFDTYNSIFHYFSDPDNAYGYGYGYGYEGDFEFLIISATPEKIVLKGKKTGCYAVMTPMSTYYKWNEYLNGIREVSKQVEKYQRMQYVSGDKVYEVRHENKAFNLYSYEDGEEKLLRYPYVLTLMGCKFYFPLPFDNGESVNEIVFNPDLGDEGGFMPVDNVNGVFLPSYPSLSEYVTSKNWFLHYDQLSPWGKSRWDVTRKAFSEGGHNMTYCYFGESYTILGTYWAFNFLASEGTGFVELQYQVLAPDRMAIELGGVTTSYGNRLLLDYKMTGMLEPFCLPERRTFTLSTDNIKNPTWIKFADEKDPDNWFTISRAKVYNPLAL